MHEQHEFIESDDLFTTGTFAYLVPGNEGRVLDGRRTPGYIESFDKESCMFIWRITAFEDKGKYWEIPAEQIGSYQFRKNSVTLTNQEAAAIEDQCKVFCQQLSIPIDEEAYRITDTLIAEQEKCAIAWLKEHSCFIAKQKSFDFQTQIGDPDLFCDLEKYMEAEGLSILERKTAEQYLLNPYSGEWIKGMKIVMAEMGLIAYNGYIPRTKDIFCNTGSKELRKKYIIARSAFLRGIFKLAGHSEVPLYRGMSSTLNLFETPNTLVSATFSPDTAREFASIDNSTAYKSCYWVKFAYPVKNLFMTFFETKQFNERYKEQEAIIYYRDKLTF